MSVAPPEAKTQSTLVEVAANVVEPATGNEEVVSFLLLIIYIRLDVLLCKSSTFSANQCVHVCLCVPPPPLGAA